MLRFAQIASQDININDLRVALLNYIISKQQNEPLLLRMDDIQNQTNKQTKQKQNLELLSLFSIDHLPAVYQSENIKQHHKMAMQLLMQKKAFSCFCTDERLQKSKQKAKQNNQQYIYEGGCDKLDDATVMNTEAPFTVRIKAPSKNIKFNDLLKGELEFTPFDIDSFIILEKDKMPTHTFACAIDDMLYDISTVVQDEKYLQDVAKQIYIRESLGYTKNINYIHIPALTITDDKIASVSWLIEEGFLPSAIANYLVLIGNDTPKEIFTLEEAIQWLDIEKISQTKIDFDLDKLKDINNKHLQSIDNMRLSKLIGYADEDFGKLAKVYLQKFDTLKEIKEKIDNILIPKNPPKEFISEFEKIKECLKEAPFIDEFSELKKYIIKQTSLEEKAVLKPLRYILTNSYESNIDLDKIYPHIKNYLGEIIK